jgi:hypothetical protein
LHLLDRQTLASHFDNAGLVDISCKGLLLTASALGLRRCKEAIAADAAAVLQLERQLSEVAVMADAGKQILATGRKPAPS